MLEPDNCMCLKPSKYLCFQKVSLFRLVRCFGVPRDGLGPHFERLLSTLGVICVVLGGPGKGLEF